MTLTLYQLPPSPNNIKVRVALGIKGIKADYVDLDLGAERSQIVAVSGQPLTPTIKHGDTVLFGSGAILRYIDANFRAQGPRLFSETQEEMREIEAWESWANGEFAGAFLHVARQFFSGQDDPAATKLANDLLRELAPKIEAALESSAFLMGEAPNAADATLYPWASYTAIDPQVPEGSPAGFFASRVQLPAEFSKTRAWIARMAAFDKR
mgnify:CR=1 FL=1|tara:strand:- start:333 stop:962 length:630 start_codon:yes stop_codon:yes gene_type:complete